MPIAIPENLYGLHSQEEQLRSRAIEWIVSNSGLQLHLTVVEQAMDLADALRKIRTEEEDFKVIQILAMRTFNAFGASLKLTLSGYAQNGALVLRDILETTFLLDLFRGDAHLIAQWRAADRRTRLDRFSPVKVRIALDERDGFTSKKRAAVYELFSELAGHPTMASISMMRPEKGGDAVIGPLYGENHPGSRNCRDGASRNSGW